MDHRGLPARQARQGRCLRAHQDQEHHDRRRGGALLQPHRQDAQGHHRDQGDGVPLQRRRAVLLHGSRNLRADAPQPQPGGGRHPVREGKHQRDHPLLQGPGLLRGSAQLCGAGNHQDRARLQGRYRHQQLQARHRGNRLRAAGAPVHQHRRQDQDRHPLRRISVPRRN